MGDSDRITQGELTQIILDHEKWLKSEGTEGERSDLSGRKIYDLVFRKEDPHECVNLSKALFVGAELSGTDLNGADLSGADLSGAELRNVDGVYVRLTGAKLKKSWLCGTRLWFARLCGADLSGACLDGSSLTMANLTGAGITPDTEFAPADLLRADWGDVSDSLAEKLMRLNASGIPQGVERYTRWANGGPYPYQDQYPTLGSPSRVVNFIERGNLWSPGSPPGLWDATEALIEEKCEESPFEVPYVQKSVGEVLEKVRDTPWCLLAILFEKRVQHINCADEDVLCVRYDGAVHVTGGGEWLIYPYEVTADKDGHSWKRLLRGANLLPEPPGTSVLS